MLLRQSTSVFSAETAVDSTERSLICVAGPNLVPIMKLDQTGPNQTISVPPANQNKRTHILLSRGLSLLVGDFTQRQILILTVSVWKMHQLLSF